ncbi:MAG: PIG-L family deacetylase [bacterium]|nr:PIG-L family deacetylase [bacterium]MDE0602728.1 PIG-L family deacetylase [bacterium]
MTILIVGAHALDAEIMAGGLAARAARDGHRVVLLHLSRGERGHPTLPPTRFARQLDDEMDRAARVLGVESRWSGLPAPIPHPDEIAPLVAAHVEELDPALLVTHWKGSWHRSHRRSHAATLAAVHQSHRRIPVIYPENCEDLDGFLPDCFLPISDVYESWLEALRCYELFRRSEPDSKAHSEIPYWSFYTATARVRGLQAGVDMAGAFMREAGSEIPSELGFRCR